MLITGEKLPDRRGSTGDLKLDMLPRKCKMGVQ